jgi:hypothetical protein
MSYKPSIFLSNEENESVWKLVKKSAEKCTNALVKKFEQKNSKPSGPVTVETFILCFVKTKNTDFYFLYLYSINKKLVWSQEVNAKLKMKRKPNIISLKVCAMYL